MKQSQYDYDDPNIPESYYESDEWLEYEQLLSQQEQEELVQRALYKKMMTVDHNIRALKEERNEVFVETAPIEKFVNLKINLYADSNYNRGNLKCDIFRNNKKESYHKNMIMDSPTSMNHNQYKIWDLLVTMLSYDNSGSILRRAKFYNPGDADTHTNEFAYFDIWSNSELIWACVILNNKIVPLKFFNFGDVISFSGTLSKSQTVDDFYQQKCKMLWK